MLHCQANNDYYLTTYMYISGFIILVFLATFFFVVNQFLNFAMNLFAVFCLALSYKNDACN